MNGGVSRRRLRSLPRPPEHWEFTRWSAERIEADQFDDKGPYVALTANTVVLNREVMVEGGADFGG